MRPCTCEKAECRLCWLYWHNSHYRNLWGETVNEPMAKVEWIPRQVREGKPCQCNQSEKQ